MWNKKENKKKTGIGSINLVSVSRVGIGYEWQISPDGLMDWVQEQGIWMARLKLWESLLQLVTY